LKHPITIYEKISWSVSSFIAKLGFSPNQITILRLLIFVPPSMFFFSLGDYFSGLIGLVFYHLFMFFDFVDGQVAHLRSMQTSLGYWLDPIIDNIGKDCIVFSLILGLNRSNLKIVAWIIGFLLIFVDGLLTHTFKLENEIKSDRKLENRITYNRLIKNIFTYGSHGEKERHPLYIVFSYGCLISFGVLFDQVFIALLLLLLTQSLQLGAELFVLCKKTK